MKKIIHRATFMICAFATLVVGAIAAPADMDPRFGTNGKVTTQMGLGNSFILDSAMQPDGKILAVGSLAMNGSQFAIVRYTKDGSLDTSFDGDGIVLTQFGTSAGARAVYVQPDGKILVAGSVSNGSATDFGVVRYNPDGSLDPTFGTDGKVVASVTQFTDVANTIAVQFDGRIIVAGTAEDGALNARFGAVRLNPNGSLDSSFGTDGKIFFGVGAASQGVKRILLLPDGKIVFVGSGNFATTALDFIVARINANGTMDTSFDGDGIVNSDIALADMAYDAALQPDGKIIVVGFADDGGTSRKFAAIRYHPNGVRDNDFGLFGTFTAQLGSNNQDAASTVVLQPDGKILIGGTTKTGFENLDIGLLRLTSGGAFDQTFGTAGKAILPVSIKDDSVNDMIFQPNGRILLAGASYDANQRFSFTLTRLLGRNTRGDYDSDGRSDIAIYRPATGTWWLNRSQTGVVATNFGLNGDKPVVGDYDGDGRNDVAVFRPSNRVWYLLQTSGGFAAWQFGLSDDVPVPADYDNDGKTDIAVYRPSTGVWHINRSQLGYTSYAFGLNGDRPVTGDFDRDGRSDAAVFRPSNGVWYVLGSRIGFYATQFGVATDVPVSGDFDGDLTNDIAVYRPSTGVWYIMRSSDGQAQIAQFGLNGDIPAAADFDGDGATDRAVFRPSDGIWYVLRSSDNQSSAQSFGLSGDIPAASVLVQ
jgi:uncharacterized delta-60 repeat protein